MSHRISLDVDPWGSADFIVGRDGDLEKANEDIWQRPLKIIFREPAALRAWIAALPDGFDVSDVWYFYHVPKGATEVRETIQHPTAKELDAWIATLEPS